MFIYMQLIHGVALRDRWDNLSVLEKTTICEQLNTIVTSLRQLRQELCHQFVGMF